LQSAELNGTLFNNPAGRGYQLLERRPVSRLKDFFEPVPMRDKHRFSPVGDIADEIARPGG